MVDLRSIRNAVGFSQVRLARVAQVSRFRLSLAESGELDLRSDELAAIRNALAPEIERAVRVAIEFNAQTHTTTVDGKR